MESAPFGRFIPTFHAFFVLMISFYVGRDTEVLEINSSRVSYDK